jgi:DNA repair protein RadC
LENLIAVVDPNNAQEIAAVLIAEFGSIGRVMNESYASLRRVIGDKISVINLLRAAQNVLIDGLLSELPHQLVSSTDQRLLDYLVATMGCRSRETLRVMFFNRSHHLVADEIVASGSVSSLTAYPRNIFKRAFELSASSVLIIHNHPGGSIEPSNADIDFTEKLAGLGLQLEVEVKDHIIIAGSKWFSFLRRGLL